MGPNLHLRIDQLHLLERPILLPRTMGSRNNDEGTGKKP